MRFAGGALTVWRPDGTVLQSDGLPLADGTEIAAQNKILDLPITPDSARSKWDGWPIDYPDAVEGLLWLEDRYRREVEARSEALPPFMGKSKHKPL
jgi:hypothetical protein